MNSIHQFNSLCCWASSFDLKLSLLYLSGFLWHACSPTYWARKGKPARKLLHARENRSEIQFFYLIGRRGRPEDEALREAFPADRRRAGCIVGGTGSSSYKEKREHEEAGHGGGGGSRSHLEYGIHQSLAERATLVHSMHLIGLPYRRRHLHYYI